MKHPAATTTTTVLKAAVALSLLVLCRSVDGFAPTLVSKAMTVMSAGRFSRGGTLFRVIWFAVTSCVIG